MTYTASCCSSWSSSTLNICDCFLYLSLFARSSFNSTFNMPNIHLLYGNKHNIHMNILRLTNKGKGNIDLYSISSRMSLMRSGMDHTMLPANSTISAFTHKHSPGGPTTHICIANAWVQLTTHESWINPKRMNGWVGHVGRHTEDGLPRGGHPSTARHGAGQEKFAGHRPTF